MSEISYRSRLLKVRTGTRKLKRKLTLDPGDPKFFQVKCEEDKFKALLCAVLYRAFKDLLLVRAGVKSCEGVCLSGATNPEVFFSSTVKHHDSKFTFYRICQELNLDRARFLRELRSRGLLD